MRQQNQDARGIEFDPDRYSHIKDNKNNTNNNVDDDDDNDAIRGRTLSRKGSVQRSRSVPPRLRAYIPRHHGEYRSGADVYGVQRSVESE